jgi:hypothetical protein
MNRPPIPQESKNTPQKKIKGAPDYDDASYWDTKFVTGQDVGEWLNKGDVLIDAAITELEQRYPSSNTTRSEVSGTEGNSFRPRALHLGPGISALGSKLCNAFVQRGWKGNDIVVCNPPRSKTNIKFSFRQQLSIRYMFYSSLKPPVFNQWKLMRKPSKMDIDFCKHKQNVDFSSEAVRIGRESEHEKINPDHLMHWIQADLCSWEEVSQSILPFAPFDVIIDKSTSDAIATSVPRTFHRPLTLSNNDGSTHNAREASKSTSGENDPAISPYLRDTLSLNLKEDNDSDKGLTLFPVELLSIHLVSLARKDAIWLVLSYSSVRFDGLPYLNQYWTVVSRTPLKAPAGQASSATAMVPDVFHWVYVLRRK